MDPKTTHPFEHMGLPPYRYMGHAELKYQACQGAPIQPGGTCDHCGTAIIDAFEFKAAGGERFKVGNVCVNQAGKEWRRYDAAIAAAERARKEVAKKKAHARADAKIAEAVAALEALAPKWAAEPHLMEGHAKRGLTKLDWAHWMLDHAGRKGKLEVAKAVEAAKEEA